MREQFRVHMVSHYDRALCDRCFTAIGQLEILPLWNLKKKYLPVDGDDSYLKVRCSQEYPL